MKRTCITATAVFTLALLWIPVTANAAKPPIPDVLGKYIGIFHSNVDGTETVLEVNVTAQKKSRFTGTLSFDGEDSLQLKGRVSRRGKFKAVARQKGMRVRLKGQSSLDGETITGTYRSRAGRSRDKGTFNVTKDDVSPSIVITLPTGLSGYSTKNSTVDLAGSASDNQSLSNVTWSNDQGGGGTAAGTIEWSVLGIILQPGDNIITVTATDLAGNTATDSITITYNPNLEFLSTPQATPDSVFVSETTTVIFRIAIENNPNLDASSVKLLKLDSNNNITGIVTTLADDGDVDNGDDIASDGVFSGKATFTEDTEGVVRLRISADTIETEGTVTSYTEVFNLSVITHLTDEEFNRAVSMPDETQQKYDELEETYGEEEAKTKTVEWLETQPEIVHAGISESGNGVWYALGSGVLGGIILNPEGTEGGRADYVPKKPLSSKSIAYKRYKSELNKSFNLKTLSPANGTETTIGSKNILVTAPFNWQWKAWGTAFEEDVYNMFNSSTCPTFNVTKIYDSSANVENFKILSNYGAVVLHTHGDTFYNNSVLQWLHEVFHLDFDFAGPQVIFLTGEKATEASKAVYEADLKKGRLAIISDYFAITPAFTTYYNKSFPDSIIYNGSCRGTYNNSMSNAFISNDAKTYFGFSDYVLSVYDRDIALTLFDSLVNQGKTTGEAFNDAITAHGPNDGQVKDPAYFKMRGSSDLTVTEGGITNGNFEEGNINGWTGQGDVRIISQLGPLSPTEGVYMNIISTGLGSISDSDSFVEQTFCIPAGVTTLSFDYNVVSEEPMEWVGTEYDDQFVAALTTSSGDTLIAHESVNTSFWTAVSGIDFYEGDDTTFMTGWKHVIVDVSGSTGTDTVTLNFHTWDRGDSIFDTAVLIDNIKLE